MRTMHIVVTIAAAALCHVAAADPTSTVVGFDDGSDGGFTGNALYTGAGGNPGGSAHHFGSFFFNDLRTGGLGEPANDAFLGDYSPFTNITLAFDIKVDSLTDFFGSPIAREIGIRLVDRDIQGGSGASGVFFNLGAVSQATHGEWTHMSVTIADPTAGELPAGWSGFGDEDPNTFEPILPPGASFASVLASVDEFAISGAIPGFFFTNANFDMRIDNVEISVPAPASVALVICGAFARRRRSR